METAKNTNFEKLGDDQEINPKLLGIRLMRPRFLPRTSRKRGYLYAKREE